MRRLILAVAGLAFIGGSASAAMVERKVGYEIDGKQFQGALVYDDGVGAKRPAIFMEPDWAGAGVAAMAQAREIAGRDYVVLVADVFGADYAPKDTKEMQAAMTVIHDDITLSRARGGKALDALLSEAGKLGIVDPTKLAGIGFCFGGGILLDLARAGRDFKALAVFHVTFPQSADPAGAAKITGPVLVLHGADDPVTSRKAIAALEDEFDAARVKWRTVLYSGTVHSFTDVTATNPATAKSSRYDAAVAKSAYREMRDFFAGIL
jgi:dienelactone hydrolase